MARKDPRNDTPIKPEMLVSLHAQNEAAKLHGRAKP